MNNTANQGVQPKPQVEMSEDEQMRQYLIKAKQTQDLANSQAKPETGMSKEEEMRQYMVKVKLAQYQHGMDKVVLSPEQEAEYNKKLMLDMSSAVNQQVIFLS